MAPWPLPREYQHGGNVIWLSHDVQYTYKPGEVQDLSDGEIWYSGLQKVGYVFLLAHCL